MPSNWHSCRDPHTPLELEMTATNPDTAPPDSSAAVADGVNLWTLLVEIAERIPDHEMVVQRDRRITYREFVERGRRLAQYLHGLGLGRHSSRDALAPWELGQDGVALLMHNRPEYLEGTFGAIAASTAPVNINYAYTPDELAYVLNDSGAGVVVYEAKFAEKVRETLPLLSSVPHLIQLADGTDVALLPGAVDYETALAQSSPAPLEIGVDGSDIYTLYTGGTTGLPKGVLWRQHDLWLATLSRGSHRQGGSLQAIADYTVGRRHHSRLLVCAPLMHGAGSLNALSAVLYGDTVYFPDVVGRLDCEDIWATVQRERIESLLIVGEAFAGPLMDALEDGAHDASSLRMFMSGGAATAVRTKERIARLMPHVTFYELLGASETGGALQRADRSDEGRLDSGVFSVRPGADVIVLDAERRVAEAPGHTEPGWLAVAGRIPLGYLNDEAKTRATFAEVGGQRYSIPGDRAKLRVDGLIEVLGRDAATINTGGEKVFAEEVEEALLGHPDVLAAVVAGRPSARWGQEVAALVVMADGSTATDEELRELAGRTLARYKLPKAILRVPELRRTAVGKFDRAWATSQLTQHDV